MHLHIDLHDLLSIKQKLPARIYGATKCDGLPVLPNTNTRGTMPLKLECIRERAVHVPADLLTEQARASRDD